MANAHLDQGILVEYLKIQKKFSDSVCTPGVIDEYNKLAKDYQGDGRYIPTTLRDKLDFSVISNFISVMNEKVAWISTQVEFVKTMGEQNALLSILNNVDNELSSYYQDKNKNHILKIKSLLDELIVSAPFLISFKFPLNHLKLRADYDHYKNSTNSEYRRRANSIYFYRKIVQDGAFDDETMRNDSVVRSAFDTLYLSIKEKVTQKSDLEDSDRVDLLYIIKNFSRLLEEGKVKQLSHLAEWNDRTKRSLLFYQDLILNKKSQNDVLLHARANALFNLKKFVLTKEAQTYEFWAKQSDLMQALFSLETILYNEVGRSDAPDALERRDVAQIVMNRSENSHYNKFSKSDVLPDYLNTNTKDQNKNKWLNVLFKEGEFSFTYFYIPENYQIYCPDMSRSGRFYRRENIRIAINSLNHPRKKFKALRYYSRVSMFGRIKMDSLWSDFIPLPEVPGKLVKNAKKLINKIGTVPRTILYKFKGKEPNDIFHVIEINNKKYVVDANNTKNIYYYRNPHLFRYFEPIK